MNQAIVVVLPVFLIVMGISYICFPPPMDGKRGYRTPLSVQSKEIWDILFELVILCFAAVSTAQALLHKMRGRK